MQYIRLSEGLNKYELIPSTENIWDRIKTNEKDYYVSIFKYNEEQYQQWRTTKTVSGIKDVVTNRLFFDFDSADNPELARQDAIELVTRLRLKGIPEDTIQIAFSGNKGFSVEVDSTESFTQEEFKNITFGLAEDLQCFDTVVNDAQRIVRVVGTKHAKSGLYKFPLSADQLAELDMTTIKKLASDLDNIDEELMERWTEVKLPDSIMSLRESKTPAKVKPVVEIDASELDMKSKPKWLSEAKFALQEGFFASGERNTAFMILASTYKNQGFKKEVVYRMLKGVAEIQATRNNVDAYSNEELWKNVVNVVYNPTWKGGQYSYENTPLLQEVTARLGLNPPTKEEAILVPVENVTDIFKKFALDIDKNTIKLGIPAIDNDIRITSSMLVGLLAAPSAGKTSVSLSVLNACSKNKVPSIFFSLDMGAPLVFQRLIQRHTGLHGKKIYEMYKNKDPKVTEFEKVISSEYSNVKFCFRSGITTEDIRNFIVKQQETTGEKVKLVVIDYLECLTGPFSDSTANTALIAQQLKDIANDLELCILLLLQPQKQAGDPSDELLSYRKIKGSSAIEQAASVIFTMWRPGFSPKNPDDDRFLTIAVVKNRMGQLATFDFSWEGLTGSLDDLDDEQQGELNELRKKKALEKAASDI